MRKIIIPALVLLIYFIYKFACGVSIYNTLSNGISSSGLLRMTESDERYGMVLKPNFKTINERPDGVNVILQTDENGFRVPRGYKNSEKVDILGLGCSFMFAESRPIEGPLLNIIADSLKINYFNLSASGFGFAQMLIRAREYIPVFKQNW